MPRPSSQTYFAARLDTSRGARLPNAPYILTDFVHLKPHPSVPLWYDIALLASAAGTGILFYTSEDAELLGLCERVLVFNAGRVAAELSGATLTAYHLTAAAYGESA